MARKPDPKLQAGMKHKNSSGLEYTIIKYNNSHDIDIRFIETGYEYKVVGAQVRTGEIKDRLYPSLYGVGFIGDGVYVASQNGPNKDAYVAWTSMIKRCYSDSYHSQKYHQNYIDCEVCEEWQCFQIFAEWYYENHPQDGERYELDKDIKSRGNKIYSPSTVKFVTKSQNFMEVQSRKMKTIILISPDGKEHTVRNCRKFERENNLSNGSISSLARGRYDQHKGWTLKEVIK